MAGVAGPPAERGTDSTVEDGAEVGRRLAALRERIGESGGDPGMVKIVGVTKGFGPQVVQAAMAAGVVDLGENYAGELGAKAAAATAVGLAPRWHFIGAIQRNKVRSVAPHVHLWHGVARVSDGVEIARWSPGAQVLVQVNVSGEATKNGVSPEGVSAIVAELTDAGLDVRGLMAIGPQGPAEAARDGFGLLARLARRLELAELSMGMTEDVEVAVQEGATMIRVGRALFGPRPHRSGLRE